MTEIPMATLRLLQLCSANLPTGAYAFSQGIETATEEGWLNSFEETEDWLKLQLEYNLGRCDLPLLIRAHQALEQDQTETLSYWNQTALALRETKEFRLTDCATAAALLRVLKGLGINDINQYFGKQDDISYVIAFAFTAYKWNINIEASCLGYAWSWLENQVAAATKLVPLGQTQSQQLLEQLQPQILSCIELANRCPDDDIGESLPMLAIASSWHEHQYSRLFRS